MTTIETLGSVLSRSYAGLFNKRRFCYTSPLLPKVLTSKENMGIFEIPLSLYKEYSKSYFTKKSIRSFGYYISNRDIFGNNATINIKKIWNTLYSMKVFNEVFKVPCGDQIYYFSPDFILDKDFTPLFLAVVQAAKQDTKLEASRFVLYINPKVFTIKDSISKAIVNIVKAGLKIRGYSNPNPNFRIVIDIFDDFFISPSKPSNLSNIDEDLNNCLINNLDMINI